MSPDAMPDRLILDKLADVAQQQAITAERLANVLERIEDHLDRMGRDQEKNVLSIKTHIDGAVQNSIDERQKSDRRMAILLGALVMLAEITRTGLDHLLQALGR